MQAVERDVPVLVAVPYRNLDNWRAFAGAGIKPLVLGLACWAVVAVSSLLVQSWTGQL